MLNFLLTILVGAVLGYVFFKLKVPGGMIVGSIIGVAIFNILTGIAYMPYTSRITAQIIAGAYIGSGFEMSDVMELKYVIFPSIVLVLGYFIACFLIGNILHKKFKMSIDEAMLTATPAGAADMVLISADMGIENSDIIVLQIIRLVSAVSIFPQIIMLIVSLFG